MGQMYHEKKDKVFQYSVQVTSQCSEEVHVLSIYEKLGRMT
jgi:hypothetical protein